MGKTLGILSSPAGQHPQQGRGAGEGAGGSAPLLRPLGASMRRGRRGPPRGPLPRGASTPSPPRSRIATANAGPGTKLFK